MNNSTFPYRISIDRLEEYMKKGIKEFIAIENLTAEDQSKRIQLCEKYFYHSYTCHNPYEMEYAKMSDETIKRIGKLNVIMHLFNNKIISAKIANELSNNVDNIEDDFNSCILHNMAINEDDQN